MLSPDSLPCRRLSPASSCCQHAPSPPPPRRPRKPPYRRRIPLATARYMIRRVATLFHPDCCYEFGSSHLWVRFPLHLVGVSCVPITRAGSRPPWRWDIVQCAAQGSNGLLASCSACLLIYSSLPLHSVCERWLGRAGTNARIAVMELFFHPSRRPVGLPVHATIAAARVRKYQ